LISILPSVLAAVALGGLAIFFGRQGLRQASREKLIGLTQTRAGQIESYFEEIRRDVLLIAASRNVLEGLEGLREAWNALGPQAMDELQRLYITQNPHPIGEKQKLRQAADGSDYSRVHGELHPWFNAVVEQRGYYDLFMVDADGTVLYSTFKEADFATNLRHGAWQGSGLAQACLDAVDGRDQAVFVDFAPYAPSNDQPASFLAAPILDAGGQRLGALAVQMPVGRINELMSRLEGLGRSGETYLVGEDNRMRSDSRFSSESTILRQTVNTKQVTEALDGRSGVIVGRDYRGARVMAAHHPMEFSGVRFAVIGEEDLADIDTLVRRLLLVLGLGLVVIVAGTVLLGLGAARGIVRPLGELTGRMTRMAEGDLQLDIPHTTRRDELGEVARAMEVFRGNGQRMREMEAEQRAREEREAADRQRMRIELADNFQDSVGQIVDAVSAAAEELQATAVTMSALSEETNSQSGTVAAAAEQSSANIRSVAAASEEMSTSIREILRQVAKSSEIASRAVDQARQADGQVAALSDAAQRISDVVELINSVAEQTNLLALNATIEAARAGDAGKGFAVVAGEVKTLAQETGTATTDIRGQIQSIQEATRLALESIRAISTVIAENGEIVTTIAGAMEEQNAATAEIVRNIEQAAQGSTEVSGGIGNVTMAAAETGSAAAQVLSAARELGGQSGQLAMQVQEFVARIRG
jgi:methyl-accepting chemotaxis protein